MTKEELIKTLEEYDKEVNKLFQENKKLKERIDKAIEYIEETKCVFGTNLDMHYLLKILKGEEK